MWILFGFFVKHIHRRKMKAQHKDDDPIYFDHYEAEALREILDMQHTIIENTTKKNTQNTYGIRSISIGFII